MEDAPDNTTRFNQRQNKFLTIKNINLSFFPGISIIKKKNKIPLSLPVAFIHTPKKIVPQKKFSLPIEKGGSSRGKNNKLLCYLQNRSLLEMNLD